MFVYVMVNHAVPDLVKVGCSHDPKTRARELNTSGVPGRWEVFAKFQVVEKYAPESAAHASLSSQRRSKEFFSISPPDAARRVAAAVTPWHIKHSLVKDDWDKWSARGAATRVDTKPEHEDSEAWSARLKRAREEEEARRERERAEKYAHHMREQKEAEAARAAEERRQREEAEWREIKTNFWLGVKISPIFMTGFFIMSLAMFGWSGVKDEFDGVIAFIVFLGPSWAFIYSFSGIRVANLFKPVVEKLVLLMKRSPPDRKSRG